MKTLETEIVTAVEELLGPNVAAKDIVRQKDRMWFLEVFNQQDPDAPKHIRLKNCAMMIREWIFKDMNNQGLVSNTDHKIQ
jgi:hypothetical protein